MSLRDHSAKLSLAAADFLEAVADELAMCAENIRNRQPITYATGGIVSPSGPPERVLQPGISFGGTELPEIR